jgi:hypothetical protein
MLNVTGKVLLSGRVEGSPVLTDDKRILYNSQTRSNTSDLQLISGLMLINKENI